MDNQKGSQWEIKEKEDDPIENQRLLRIWLDQQDNKQRKRKDIPKTNSTIHVQFKSIC